MPVFVVIDRGWGFALLTHSVRYIQSAHRRLGLIVRFPSTNIEFGHVDT